MATRYEHQDVSTGGIAGGYTYAGQTFTPQISHTIRMVKFACNPTSLTHVVEIFATDEDGKPTGLALASGVMEGTYFHPYCHVSLGAGAALVAGNLYAIRMVTGWPEDNTTFYGHHANPYPNGALFWGTSGETYYLTDKDMKFEEWDGTTPTQPVQTSPADESIGVSLTPTLQATYHHCAAKAQAVAQWQIDVDGGDFSSPVWDSGEDAVNLLSITVPGGILDSLTDYDWRVRHKDIDGEWSSWSWIWDFQTVGLAPTVTTQAVTEIEPTTAIGNGNITDLGDTDPTAHGVCWNTTGTPTIADDKTDEGAAEATGAFTSLITGLVANTLYYVRAYATNSIGTGYGNEVSFTTEPLITAGNRAHIIG